MSQIDAAALRRALPAGYAELTVVESTGSTNADLLARVAEGAPDRTALLAEEQTAGVGRQARQWASPKGTGIYLSLLLRPAGVPFARLGSLAAAAGLAVADAAAGAGVRAELKWPNDVLAGPDGAKCAGILAEGAATEEAALVLGIGLNVLPLGERVAPGAGGLPATSLAEQGATTTDRTELAAALLRALRLREQAWREGGGDLLRAGLLEEYRERCGTLGRRVTVMLPDGGRLEGRAAEVDGDCRLLVDDGADRRHTVLAGDVVHLRTAG
jgi:BirA family biotin operon repressor/biotin-[acetyl-CoA-carboxylase] ligase